MASRNIIVSSYKFIILAHKILSSTLTNLPTGYHKIRKDANLTYTYNLLYLPYNHKQRSAISNIINNKAMYRITIEEKGVNKNGGLDAPVVLYKKESNDYTQVKEILKKTIDLKGDHIPENYQK